MKRQPKIICRQVASGVTLQYHLSPHQPSNPTLPKLSRASLFRLLLLLLLQPANEQQSGGDADAGVGHVERWPAVVHQWNGEVEEVDNVTSGQAIPQRRVLHVAQ